MTKQINQKEFKRVETKYLVEAQQLPALLQDLNDHMQADDFAQSTITSLYFDTENFQMIQDSLAKKHGKEKLRLRTYAAQPGLDSPAFLEIKQKIAGVGYKYRVKTTPQEALTALAGTGNSVSQDVRMTDQLALLQDRYQTIQPRMLISYNRLSFKGKDDAAVRVTLDRDLTYAPVTSLTLSSSAAIPLVTNNQLVMEIKVSDQLPTWLQTILAKYNLEKASFSKYGQAYQLHQANLIDKEARYA